MYDCQFIRKKYKDEKILEGFFSQGPISVRHFYCVRQTLLFYYRNKFTHNIDKLGWYALFMILGGGGVGVELSLEGADIFLRGVRLICLAFILVLN